MSNQQFERLVSNLQGIMRCPHCSGSYDTSDIHYLGQMEDMTFLHMRCAGCKTPVFASVAIASADGEIKPADIASEQIFTNIEEEANSQAEMQFTRKQLDVEPIDVTGAQEIEIEESEVGSVLNAALSPVGYNDVLDVHQYLGGFSGDFEAILD